MLIGCENGDEKGEKSLDFVASTKIACDDAQ